MCGVCTVMMECIVTMTTATKFRKEKKTVSSRNVFVFVLVCERYMCVHINTNKIVSYD